MFFKQTLNISILANSKPGEVLLSDIFNLNH